MLGISFPQGPAVSITAETASAMVFGGLCWNNWNSDIKRSASSDFSIQADWFGRVLSSQVMTRFSPIVNWQDPVHGSVGGNLLWPLDSLSDISKSVLCMDYEVLPVQDLGCAWHPPNLHLILEGMYSWLIFYMLAVVDTEHAFTSSFRCSCRIQTEH